MADEKSTTEPTTETREEGTEATEAPAATTAEAATPTMEGAGPEGGPVPGDPSSEQVATAAQSHVAGRVGPPSIQQDANAPEHTGEGVEQIKPGQVVPATTVAEGGPVPLGDAPAVVVARAIDSDEASTASGASGSPTSPAEGSTSSGRSGSAGAPGGTAGGSAGSSGTSEPSGSAGSSK